MGSSIAPIVVANSDPASSVWAYRNVVASGNAVTSVNAGSGVTITGTPTAPIVNATASGVLSITPANGTFGGGTGGIFVGGTSSAATIANTGVLSVTAGTNCSLGGTSANPTINVPTGAGGVTSITAGTNCSLGGTAANPIINVPTGAGGVVALSAVTSSVGAGTGGILIAGTSSNPTVANTGILSVIIAAGISQFTAVTNASTGRVTITPPSNVVTTLSSANTNCTVDNAIPSAPVITVPTAAGGVTSINTSPVSSQITITNNPGGISTLNIPGNFVTSVTSGNSNIVVGGSSAATTVALADPISLASGVSVTGTGTLSVNGTSTLTGKVTLGNPLTLSNVIPTLATQLGYTVGYNFTGTNNAALVSGTRTQYSTGSISQPGVYTVNIFCQMNWDNNTVVQGAQVYFEATNVTAGSYAMHNIAYPNTAFTTGGYVVLPISTVIIVPATVTVGAPAVLTLSVTGTFSVGTMRQIYGNFQFLVTRIA